MLKNKKLFLFDIDGTIAVGDTLFEGSLELIQHIEDIGGRSFYITNNSTKSRGDYIEKFKRWDIKTMEEQFVTSGFLTTNYLKQNFLTDKIYVLGTESFIKELRAEGLNITEEAERDVKCIVVGYDNTLTYEKAVKACELLTVTSAEYIATNPDLCCPAPFGFIPDCGAICALIESSVDRKPVYIGKPSKAAVEVCMEISGFTAEETLVIGDRLYTDIACGINAGVETCVVLTGEATAAQLETTEFKPDYCFDDIEGLLKAVKEGK